MAPRVGVLAIQGSYEAHRASLARLGTDAMEVLYPEQMESLDGLILPGGESTTHLKILEERGLAAALGGFHRSGGAIFGTCSGAILLARSVSNPEQPSLGLLDIDIRRNAYGRQAESFEREVRVPGLGEAPLPMVFIRAPRITRIGEGVEVIAAMEGEPVLVRRDGVLAGTFHPELSADGRVHGLFLKIAAERARKPAMTAS